MSLCKHNRLPWKLALASLFVAVFLAGSYDRKAQGPSSHLRKLQETETHSRFRSVTFGSSRTWGAAIKDRENLSFAGLMGAKNLAIRASGPEYPALCTYSMIGDNDIYDVIVIEYMPDWVSDALNVLGERLRHRFPDATIIFVAYWAPRQYVYMPKQQTLTVFYREQKKRPSDTVESMLDKTNAQDWEYHPYDHKVIEEAARRVGGFILDLPMYEDPIETLKKFTPLYVDDMTHFSEEGHRYVRDQIYELLTRINAKPSDRVVNWESLDICTSWFETGKVGLNTTMEMVEFKDHKFALEAKPVTHDNIIELENPNEQKAYLYASYMATGPDQIYPNALLRIKQNGEETGAKHFRPFIADTPYGNQFHVVMHGLVGPVNPGKSELSVVAMTSGHRERFRMVGMILSPRVFGQKVAAAL